MPKESFEEAGRDEGHLEMVWYFEWERAIGAGPSGHREPWRRALGSSLCSCRCRIKAQTWVRFRWSQNRIAICQKYVRKTQ